jgi:hypothetical protein
MRAISVNSDLKVLNNTLFRINDIQNDHSEDTKHETLNASLYFMVPGLGHGLRINGSLCSDKTNQIFKIEQVYFHCARAAARAELWLPNTAPLIDKHNIIQQSPFLLLKTINSEGKTEVSPRGDKAGFIKVLSDQTLLLPERPGNKIAVSLRNILECSKVELLLLVPCSNKTLNIKGTAIATSDQTRLNQCTVNGKTPKVGILIEIESSQFSNDKALKASELWDNKNAVEKNSVTSFSKALSSHINGIGLLGKATNIIVGAHVKHDMQNLY